jgi:3-dehydroquinate synthase
MRTLTVALGERSYPIHIGPGVLERPELIVERLPQKRAAIVSNEIVAPLYLDAVESRLHAAGIETLRIILPDGEDHKNGQTLDTIFDALLEHRCERRTTIIALGGGVVGDVAGFAAAVYQRGVPFVQVPTTLLAQVDSAVGGKTAINHPLGKNMIGAFYQPRVVVADTDTLSTLPPRELSAGLAEVIKYGFIRDPEFLDWLDSHMDALLAREAEALGYAIERSCRNKAEVVGADEHEGGVRALLNFGHTFGHAIETATGYGTWLHGEAVAMGMVLASRLSQQLGHLSASDVDRVEGMLARARLPVRAPDLGAREYIDLMGHDKKVQSGRLKFILLRTLGDAFVGEAPDAALTELLSGPAVHA